VIGKAPSQGVDEVETEDATPELEWLLSPGATHFRLLAPLDLSDLPNEYNSVLTIN
jgi:hypothetical protein